ncbi:unnamed protein product [Candida verbasci]|uniref:5'-deoxynucleotidase n=1 Tax=Candida verbasci TaxID=1227364 RepID=A0A9W4TRS9_9ASCO|nr:unnamed protein product [Candida verbasci]
MILKSILPSHCIRLTHFSFNRSYRTKSIMNSIKNLTINEWKPEDSISKKIKDLLIPISKNGTIPKMNYMLAFLQIIKSLKFQKRTGWIDHGIPVLKTESIADHMYRMSIISMMVPPNIDSNKCVKIAVIHDIAECLVGDITPFGGISKDEKHRRECETINYLSELIKPYNAEFSEEMLELWLDYEEIRTIEARYVKDIDKYEMIHTAWEYELEYGLKYNLDQFFTARAAIKTKEIGELADSVLEKRTKLMNDLKEKEQEKAKEKLKDSKITTSTESKSVDVQPTL